MIYALMYMNAESELEIARYDTATRMYQFSKAMIPPDVQLDGVNYAHPEPNQVYVAYEATPGEIEKNALGEAPSREGASAAWLKPIGQFHAALDERTGKPVEHAYMLIEQLHRDRAIPAFFENLIATLKQHGVLREDGTQNPDTTGEFTTTQVFGRDGSTKDRVIH